jgi:hypothetical protein
VNYSNAYTITSGGGDYVMMTYYPGTSFSVFKRNSEGYYDLLTTSSLGNNVNSIATNGNWFSYVLSTGSAQIFQMNGTSIINSTPIASGSTFTSVLSDDSVIFLGSSSIKTYKYINTTWTLVDTSSATLPSAGLVTPYHMTDNTLAIYESGASLVKLYTRFSNSSWRVQDQFSYSTSQVSRIIWNGDDTVVLTYHLGSSDPRGVVRIYVKVDNTWTNTNTTTAADIGITSVGYFGQHVALLDNHNIAISAPYDGQGGSRGYDSGSVLLLTRTSTSSWSYSYQLESRMRGAIYGTSLTVNGRDLLIGQCTVQVPIDLSSFSLDCSFHPLPRCFYQPINVTCNDITLDTCSTFPDLSAVEMFEVNNPLCGTTTSTLDRVQFSGTSLRADFTFARANVVPVTCNITLACPASPVALNPDGTVIPVAPQSQSTPSSQISNVAIRSASLIASLLFILLIVV